MYTKEGAVATALDIILYNNISNVVEDNPAKVLVTNAINRGSLDNVSSIVINVQEKIIFND